MAVVYNDYLTQAKKYYSSKRDEEKLRRNAIYDEQARVLNDTYNAEISNAEKGYEDLYRENAVQKTINEREVAENMANMGLTDSGLNRTQQTAVQLSYANNRGNITRQKQAEVDYLARTLAAELSKVEQNRISDMATIDQTYDNYETSMANENYKSALDAETDRIKSTYKNEQIANYIIPNNDSTLSKSMLGSFDDNNVSVKAEYGKNSSGNSVLVGYTYVDNVSGKKTYFDVGVNPFTGTPHKNVKNGTFSNGYQPDNIGKNKKLHVASGGEKAVTFNGQKQNVWTYDNVNYYVWDGRNNDYIPVYKENGKWVID